jgi:hypothetical protein
MTGGWENMIKIVPNQCWMPVTARRLLIQYPRGLPFLDSPWSVVRPEDFAHPVPALRSHRQPLLFSEQLPLVLLVVRLHYRIIGLPPFRAGKPVVRVHPPMGRLGALPVQLTVSPMSAPTARTRFCFGYCGFAHGFTFFIVSVRFVVSERVAFPLYS